MLPHTSTEGHGLHARERQHALALARNARSTNNKTSHLQSRRGKRPCRLLHATAQQKGWH
eukprot:4355045-Pyramimonas_sp.AAC.1